MNKILCNDIVSIDLNYTYENYSTYTEWLDFYFLSKENYVSIQGGFTIHIKNNKIIEDFIVEWIAPHLKFNKMLYLIKGKESGCRFIVGRKAIKNYYHTCASVDKSELVEQIIMKNFNQEKKELQDKILSIESDNKILQKRLNQIKTAKNTPMPPLENGMFGIVKGKFEDDIKFFVVVKNKETTRLIYQNGGYDKYNENVLTEDPYNLSFNKEGIVQNEDLYFEISYLIKANSFEEARTYFEISCSMDSFEKTLFKKVEENIIWKRN